MNLLIQISSRNNEGKREDFSAVCNDYESFISAIYHSGINFIKGRKLVPNQGAETLINKIFDGSIEPQKNYIIGNAYYGGVYLYFADDYNDIIPVKIKVTSALGRTLEEHYARFERLKKVTTEKFKAESDYEKERFHIYIQKKIDAKHKDYSIIDPGFYRVTIEKVAVLGIENNKIVKPHEEKYSCMVEANTKMQAFEKAYSKLSNDYAKIFVTNDFEPTGVVVLESWHNPSITITKLD